MNTHKLKPSHLPLVGLGLGIIVGMIVFSFLISCANSLPTNPTASGWCSDETAELMLPPGFLPTITFSFLLSALTGYDLLEGNSALFDVIMWTFGVSIYGSIGAAIGWIINCVRKPYGQDQ